MSENLESLTRRIGTISELGSVVRTMKALAASNVAQFDQAARSSDEYAKVVASGLSVCLDGDFLASKLLDDGRPAIVVFGSDQGLVGAFNEMLASFVVGLEDISSAKIWAVGERIAASLTESGISVDGTFSMPGSVEAIASLISGVAAVLESELDCGSIGSVTLVHNRPTNSTYGAVKERILPFDTEWKKGILSRPWSGHSIPEAIDPDGATLKALLRECLFVSLFRACAESLASENRSRLVAMDLAQKNIADLQGDLMRSYHRLRQDTIDEELFDVVFGFEALSKAPRG